MNVSPPTKVVTIVEQLLTSRSVVMSTLDEPLRNSLMIMSLSFCSMSPCYQREGGGKGTQECEEEQGDTRKKEKWTRPKRRREERKGGWKRKEQGREAQ